MTSQQHIIHLGHGSGGSLTHELLDRYIFSRFRHPLLQQQHDGVVFQGDGRLAFSTDSFVVSPIFFPGGDIGELAVNGTVNDLAMCGAEPLYMSLALILEEGLQLEQLEQVLQSIANAAERAGIHIVTGDTKVVEKGKGDKIFINTTGIGRVHARANISHERIAVGDTIICSGPMARHGITILSQREGMGFDIPVVSDTKPLHQPVLHLLDQEGEYVKLLRDPTRGGVGTVLNELALQSKWGVRLDASQLPVESEVAGACEMLGLDPLLVANEGLFLAFMAPEKADAALHILHQHPETAQAVAIGKVVADHPGKVVEYNAMGGRRVVPMLAGEQLPRIC